MGVTARAESQSLNETIDETESRTTTTKISFASGRRYLVNLKAIPNMTLVYHKYV